MLLSHLPEHQYKSGTGPHEFGHTTNLPKIRRMNGADRDELSGASSRGVRGQANIAVSVECPAEPRIAEITFDGREIPQPPVSRAEKLYRNACKLDFRKIDLKDQAVDELVSISVEEARERESGRQTRSRPDASTVVWGLESVRTKLRTAHTEISVLHDVMSLGKERKYIRLEPVVNDPMEQKPHFNLHYKKKALIGIGSMLTAGADRLRRSATDAAAVQKTETDYHTALIKLRDQWRLKKQGQQVSGDLSYRTAGSSLKGVGQFEIKKNDEDAEKSFEVVITGDLSGESFIQIDLLTPDFEPQPDNRRTEILTGDVWAKIVTLDNPWHRKLISAQNALYCREISTLLSAEAVSLPDHMVNPIVFSDEVHYSMLSGDGMRVKLVQISPNEKVPGVRRPHTDGAHSFGPSSTLTESRILEHSLALMLLERMRDLSATDIPIPACGPVALKIYRRKMAIQARDRRVWKSSLSGRSLTSELLARANAMLLRKRCLKLADQLSSSDLTVTVHDCSFSTSWKHMNIKITLTSPGYDLYHRTNCAFNIVEGQVNFVTRDFTTPISADVVVDCSLLYLEIVRQHAVVFQYFLKVHRFEFMHYTPVHSYYSLEKRPGSPSLTNAMKYAIVITAKSLDSRWMIKVICSLRYVYRLFVADMKHRQIKTTAIREESFLHPDPEFHELDLSRIYDGQTRLRRMALVLGYLLSLPDDSQFPSANNVASSAPQPMRLGSEWMKWSSSVV